MAFSPHDAGRTPIGPCYSESDDDKQCREFSGVGNICVFDIEAACLGIGEHAFDPPPLAIEVEGKHPPKAVAVRC